jgi:hypothetical protein
MASMGEERARGVVQSYEGETGELVVSLHRAELPAVFEACRPAVRSELPSRRTREAPRGTRGPGGQRRARRARAHWRYPGGRGGAVGRPPGAQRNLWAVWVAASGRDGRKPHRVPSTQTAAGSNGFNPSQAAAVARALDGDVTYVWGPPGTGKTRTLARLVAEWIRRGRRVAVLAPTNVAADTLGRALLEDGDAAVVRPCAGVGRHRPGREASAWLARRVWTWMRRRSVLQQHGPGACSSRWAAAWAAVPLCTAPGRHDSGACRVRLALSHSRRAEPRHCGSARPTLELAGYRLGVLS